MNYEPVNAELILQTHHFATAFQIHRREIVTGALARTAVPKDLV